MRTVFMSWGLVFLSALFDSYAAFIVKSQFNRLGRMDFGSVQGVVDYLFQFVRSPILLTAAITFVLAPCLWFFALNRLSLSLAYPVLVGFHLLFIFVFGVAFLGEGLGIHKVIGSLLVLASLYFFSRAEAA